MLCPACGSNNTSIVKTVDKTKLIRRTRRCADCGNRFATIEMLETDAPDTKGTSKPRSKERTVATVDSLKAAAARIAKQGKETPRKEEAVAAKPKKKSTKKATSKKALTKRSTKKAVRKEEAKRSGLRPEDIELDIERDYDMDPRVAADIKTFAAELAMMDDFK